MIDEMIERLALAFYLRFNAYSDAPKPAYCHDCDEYSNCGGCPERDIQDEQARVESFYWKSLFLCSDESTYLKGNQEEIDQIKEALSTLYKAEEDAKNYSGTSSESAYKVGRAYEAVRKFLLSTEIQMSKRLTENAIDMFRKAIRLDPESAADAKHWFKKLEEENNAKI